MDPSLTAAIRNLVLDLVAREYKKVASDGRIGRLTEQELRTAISDYGRTLAPIPDQGWSLIDVFPNRDGSTLAIDVPLWTAEEGRSDLTLSLAAKKHADDYAIEITDLHVL